MTAWWPSAVTGEAAVVHIVARLFAVCSGLDALSSLWELPNWLLLVVVPIEVWRIIPRL